MTLKPVTPRAAPKGSALLTCQECGKQERVFLNGCRACKDPMVAWYEDRIAVLEEEKHSMLLELGELRTTIEERAEEYTDDELASENERLEDEVEVWKAMYRALEKIQGVDDD